MDVSVIFFMVFTFEVSVWKEVAQPEWRASEQPYEDGEMGSARALLVAQLLLFLAAHLRLRLCQGLLLRALLVLHLSGVAPRCVGPSPQDRARRTCRTTRT
jgi:hypothetical protein